MLKRIFGMSLLLFAAVALVGCTAVNQPATSPTELQINTAITNNETTIRAASSIGTSVALVSVKPEDRQKVATVLYESAVAVNKAASASGADLSGLRTVVANVFAKEAPNYAPAADAVFVLGQGLVEASLNKEMADAAPTSRAKAAQVLIRAVTAGVMDATFAYADPSVRVQPSTQPVADGRGAWPYSDALAEKRAQPSDPSPADRTAAC